MPITSTFRSCAVTAAKEEEEGGGEKGKGNVIERVLRRQEICEPTRTVDASNVRGHYSVRDGTG